MALYSVADGVSSFNTSLTWAVRKYILRPTQTIVGLSIREVSLSEYRDTRMPSTDRSSSLAMSGKLINGPNRSSKYCSVVIGNFAMVGEVERSFTQ